MLTNSKRRVDAALTWWRNLDRDHGPGLYRCFVWALLIALLGPLILTTGLFFVAGAAAKGGLPETADWLQGVFRVVCDLSVWYYLTVLPRAFLLVGIIVGPWLVIDSYGLGALVTLIGGLAVLLDHNVRSMIDKLTFPQIRHAPMPGDPSPEELARMPHVDLNTLWIGLPLLAIGIPLMIWRSRRMRRNPAATARPI